MYRNCIFCSAELGANQSLESFPVGRSIAFDPWKGRLWVVCPACARWNLSALEERWEAVEDAERLFRDARLRVQSENVGLARLPEGTRLIRVGKALAGEIAAWRYGGQLVRRRRRYLMTAAAGTVVIGAAWSGIAAMGVVGSTISLWSIAAQSWEAHRRRRVVHRIEPEESLTGTEIIIRRWHVLGSQLGESADGEIALSIPDVRRKDPQQGRWGQLKYTDEPLVLEGAVARTILGRSMVHVNESGAGRRRVETAVQMLADAGSAEAYLRETARRRTPLKKRKDLSTPPLPQEGALALEMALHEETERRAMNGELALLESAWREAEKIAAIADLLPDDPLSRLRARMERPEEAG